MEFMFNMCYNLKKIKGINNFITTNVINMIRMFGDCKKLDYLDLSKLILLMLMEKGCSVAVIN